MGNFALTPDLPFEVEFAERTIWNLEVIERVADGRLVLDTSDLPFPDHISIDPAFEATQLINSLTGLLLFPKERGHHLRARYQHPVTLLRDLKEFCRVGDDMAWANEVLLPRIRGEVSGSDRTTGLPIGLNDQERNLGQIIIRMRNAVAHSRRSNVDDEVGGFYVYPHQSWPHGVRGFSFQSTLDGGRVGRVWSVTLSLADLKALVYLYVKELYGERSPFIASLDVRHLAH